MTSTVPEIWRTEARPRWYEIAFTRERCEVCLILLQTGTMQEVAHQVAVVRLSRDIDRIMYDGGPRILGSIVIAAISFMCRESLFGVGLSFMGLALSLWGLAAILQVARLDVNARYEQHKLAVTKEWTALKFRGAL